MLLLLILIDVTANPINTCPTAEQCEDQGMAYADCQCVAKEETCQVTTDGTAAQSGKSGELVWKSPGSAPPPYQVKKSGAPQTYSGYAVATVKDSLGCSVRPSAKTVSKRRPSGSSRP